MNKKLLIVYISGGVLSLLIIVATIIVAMGIKNKPVNICTTLLTNDMASALLEGYSEIKHEKTSEYIVNKDARDAYISLIDNSSDVVLASEIDDETIKWLKLNGVEVEKTTIARDALVFINNADNLVENLAVSQAKGIYSGQYTNWSNVGGNDEEIIAYPSETGSEETYMLEKLMGNKAIKKPRYKLEDSSLSGLITATSEYLDTRTKAIFYTTFHNMKSNKNENIRILKLDGTEASTDEIKSEQYPAIMDIYAIIRSDTPENSQTRRFVEYITSKNGQAIIQQCGYVNLIK